ncbi:response regulator transcription factor [Nibrella saemangeumensis]|uniref:Response regulator transcription factor n=1 Tax=Nibrella saemangeumensis TaxID=1084526 RepID=A0ABP8MM92_9BACT
MSVQSTATILVVEDEAKVAAVLRRGLETQSYRALVAPDGATARQLLGEEHIDLVILDLNLPDISGLDVSQTIRQFKPQLPILMLTALDTTADKLAGFEAGADDYLVKPFDFLELLARVKALLRRSAEQPEKRTILRVADLELDLDEKVARRAGQEIELTAREYLLLEYLMRNRGRVLSRLDIAENVWDINFDTGTNVIDVYINYLRKKIDVHIPKLIHTVVGMGYTLKEK